MLSVPLNAVPSQTVTVNLGNQPCQITVRQTRFGLFLDLSVNNALIIGGVLCENLNRIVRDLYLGFAGDLMFLDNQADPGTDGTDPIYTGLGTRYTLMYLEADELPAGVG